MSNSNLNIIVESKVPFLDGLLEPYANVRYLDPHEITPDAVADVDGMIIRTRTRCNAELLGRSRCKFIATATIGLDHIDTEWCKANGIYATNAPGCNAPAVAQYVFGSLMQVINRSLSGQTIGIVGVGHVGRIVERWARTLDMKVMRCDPPRQRAEGGDDWYDLATIAREADIVTFHTPLIRESEDSTYHIANEEFFSSLRRAPIFINCARGPITDTNALINAIDCGLVGPTVIDTWEGEPKINMRLLHRATIATPHIAGYSLEGKIRASQMSIDALCEYFNLPHIEVATPVPADAVCAVSAFDIYKSYNPLESDDPVLRNNPHRFEELRDNYALRHEVGE